MKKIVLTVLTLTSMMPVMADQNVEMADSSRVYDLDEVYCVWENSLKENNVVDIDINFFVPNGELYERYEESFSERAYTENELTDMLKGAGFEVVKRFGDMTDKAPSDDEQRVIYIAKKK